MNLRIVRIIAWHIATGMLAVSVNAPAAEPAPRKGNGKRDGEARRQAATPKPDPVRDSLNAILAAASASWSAKDFAAVREHCGKVLAQADAPSHFRSYTQLRIAQSYATEGNSAAATAEYAKIKTNAAYPEVHRYEAGECLKELERVAQGLPARDPETSRSSVPAIAEFAVEYFVSPAGNNANSGTREEPFASLEGARDAIRALKAKGGLPGPVCVRLLPGQYSVTKTFELSQDDSGTAEAPIVYQADQKGAAVLYGGKRLTGFAPVTDATVLARLPEEARANVFQCDVRRQGVADLAPLEERGYGKPAPKTTLELFFNGEPLTLARWPNSGFVNGGAIIEPGSKKEGRPSVFEYLDDRHARWTNAADGWLFGYFRHGWADRTLKIQSIDPASKRVACDPYEQGGFGMEPVKWFNKARIKYYAFNLLEELDQPGEWYLDRQTGILYFYPPSDPAQATVEVGMLAVPMLSLANAAHVRVECLVFDLSRSSGMLIRDSEHCLIAGCTLKRFAGTGIKLTGGHENGISGGYNASNDWWQRVNTAPAFTVTDLYLERYPDLRRLGTEPAWNSAWRNVFWKCGPTFNTYGRPSADKFDLLANAEYADGDPGFVDAPNGDFRFKPAAAACGIGRVAESCVDPCEDHGQRVQSSPQKPFIAKNAQETSTAHQQRESGRRRLPPVR